MMIVVFLVVSILLALLMVSLAKGNTDDMLIFLQWVRPPDATFGAVGASTTQNVVRQHFFVFVCLSFLPGSTRLGKHHS
jgi:hypothetical protein